MKGLMEKEDDNVALVRAQRRTLDPRIKRVPSKEEITSAENKERAAKRLRDIDAGRSLQYRCVIYDGGAISALASTSDTPRGSCVIVPPRAQGRRVPKNDGSKKREEVEGVREMLGPFSTLDDCEAACDYRKQELQKLEDESGPDGGEPSEDEMSRAVIQAVFITVAALLAVALLSKFFHIGRGDGNSSTESANVPYGVTAPQGVSSNIYIDPNMPYM